MKLLFLFVLRLSLSTSIAALFVMCARLLLARAPKKLSSLLWYAVLFRMLCPLHIPMESVFARLSGSVSYVVPQIRQLADLPQNAAQAITEAVETAASNQHASADWLAALSLLWLCVAAVLLIKTAADTLRLAKAVQGAQQIASGVLLHQNVQTAFVLGMLRPRIYLPAGLSAEQQEMVLEHERCHIRRGDHIAKLLFYCAACLHWFNPTVWLAWRFMQQDMEMACDEQVLRLADTQRKQLYCHTILNFAEARQCAASAAFAEKPTERRIRNILRFSQPKKAVLVLGILVVVSVVAVSLCLPVKAVGISETDPEQAVQTAEQPQTENGAQGQSPVTDDAQPVWHFPLAEDRTLVTRSFTAGRHEALDMLAQFGSSVFAAAEGTVLETAFDAERGNYVVLQHAGGYESHYYHLESISVSAGDTVAAMAPIGTAGATGNATGVHLHFAVLLDGTAIDPAPLLGITY